MIENKMIGYKKYVNPLILWKTPVQVGEDVPDDIDDICVNEVPQEADLSDCKGKRPWYKEQTSKSSAFTKGPRLTMNCLGSLTRIVQISHILK